MKKKITCVILIIIMLSFLLLAGCNSDNSQADNSLVGTWKVAEEIDHDVQGLYFWDTIVFRADGYVEVHFPYGPVPMELFQWRTYENILYSRQSYWHQRLDVTGDSDFDDEGSIMWSEREDEMNFYFSGNRLVIFNDESRIELIKYE